MGNLGSEWLGRYFTVLVHSTAYRRYRFWPQKLCHLSFLELDCAQLLDLSVLETAFDCRSLTVLDQRVNDPSSNQLSAAIRDCTVACIAKSPQKATDG